MMFYVMTLAIMVVITVFSFAMSKEFFSAVIYKSARKKLLAINIFFMLASSIVVNFVPREHTGFMAEIAVMWFILQLFLSIIALLVKIFRFVYEKTSKQKVDEGKRRFLRGLIWVPAISGVFYGGLYERRHIQFTEINVDASSTPKLKGLKIAHLTDVHLGNFFSVARLQEVLTQIAQQSPDILAITGDIFDDVTLNDEAMKVIDSFTSYFPFGVYFCWGNHEYLRGIDHLRELMAKTNIKLLNNSSVKIYSGEKPVYILGVDYLDGERDPAMAKQRDAYLNKALKNVPENAYKILLTHHSIFIDEAFKHNIDLTMAGHTHGGQFAIAGMPLFHVFKYMMGEYRQNNCLAYVSRGAGSWFPYRIGCPPEVTMFKFN